MSEPMLPPRCAFTLTNERVETDGSVKGRITGTMLAAVLGESPYSTPFKAACELLGVYSEDVGDKPAVKTGRALERRIIDHAKEEWSGLGAFLRADEVFEKRVGDHSEWPSDFDDDVFAGHIDGMVMAPDGSERILEVKTGRDLRAWENGLPRHYWWQVALYNEFITKADSAVVVLGAVEEADYRRPDLWRPEGRCALFEVPMDHQEAERGIALARSWWHEYVEQGRTPPYDLSNPIDAEIVSRLRTVSEGIDGKRAALDELAGLEERIREEEERTAALYTRKEQIRAEMKMWLQTAGMDELTTTDGGMRFYATETRKAHVDPALMMEAGVDPTPFTVEKVTKTYYFKPVKKGKEE